MLIVVDHPEKTILKDLFGDVYTFDNAKDAKEFSEFFYYSPPAAIAIYELGHYEIGQINK